MTVRPQLAALSLAIGVAGCALFGGGGGGPPKARGTQVSVPDGWHETERGDSDHAYRLPSGSIATLNSSCSRESKAPLEILTKQLLFGARNVKIRRREPLSIQGGEGLHTSLSATEDGYPFRLELVVVRKEGCIFDFSLMNPKDIGAGELDQFVAFVKSFRYGKN